MDYGYIILKQYHNIYIQLSTIIDLGIINIDIM
jgi:hypothetical protein